MYYKTFDPAPELRELIKCYWILESPEEAVPERQTIVPDGCMEMIFHYGDLYRQYLADGSNIVQPRCFVIGQLTQPLEIEPTGTTGIFSVRFLPGGFLPFANLPIREMENTAVSLEQLFGNDGLEMEQKILNTPSVTERIQHIERFLLDRLTDAKTIDRIIKTTVETILTANGQLTIEAVSKQTHANRRQLERKFATTIGLSPKQLSKMVRLQATLKMMLNNQFTSLTTLAYENEYYDQAHFSKDFKELTGFTPKEFYDDQLKMSALFYGTE
ncbi:helix-turn-helix transcriptional regulator [Flavobacterium sp.]|uniref:helix-turn-helix transcriptional regulator n=1 Tax=Flavobacterium sp. TaxID=239 RepID=UPI002638D304|nr:helix-turn-helix transcriptional regulator [Flavobacterium sp.]